jgi:hypothetical protein
MIQHNNFEIVLDSSTPLENTKAGWISTAETFHTRKSRTIRNYPGFFLSQRYKVERFWMVQHWFSQAIIVEDG